MTISRLPFILEDLAEELRRLCGDDAEALLALDAVSYEKVQRELDNHYGAQVAGVSGVSIGNATEQAERIASLEEAKEDYMRAAGM